MATVKKRTWKNKDGSESQTWVVDYTDNLGKRVTKSGFKRRVDAESYLAKIIQEKEKGTCIHANKKLIFKIVAEEFMRENASNNCKPSTFIRYKGILKNHLYPYFGEMKLIDIKPSHISQYITLKKEENLSPKTINHTLILMGSIFKRAMIEGYIFRNPAYLVKKLKLEHNEMDFLTKEEIKIFLDYVKQNDPNYYPLFLTAISTGMRRGELLALTWDDIDFVNAKVYVNKSLFRGKLQTPKTKNSIRKINMPSLLAEVLKELKEKKPDTNIVFSNALGQHLDPDNMMKRHFLKDLEGAGLRKIRFHDLRHTFASALIASNEIPIKYIQMQMGHSSIQVTLDRYGHLMPEVHTQGIKVMDGILG